MDGTSFHGDAWRTSVAVGWRDVSFSRSRWDQELLTVGGTAVEGPLRHFGKVQPGTFGPAVQQWCFPLDAHKRCKSVVELFCCFYGWLFTKNCNSTAAKKTKDSWLHSVKVKKIDSLGFFFLVCWCFLYIIFFKSVLIFQPFQLHRFQFLGVFSPSFFKNSISTLDFSD